MSLPTPLLLGAVAAIACSVSPAHAFTIAFSNADFGTSPVFSNVQTFNYDIDLGEPLTSGLFADPTINTIEYNVSGSLATTPSGFSGFNFQLSHLVAPPPAGPTSILGSLFYALNGTPTPGQTLRFQVSATANLSDGLQVSELEDLGGGVVFRINGRETGEDGRPGRYHPAFLELKNDGTGRIQNANNQGGINPSTQEVVNVDFGEEYITDLTFNPGRFTIGIPEPDSMILVGLSGLLLVIRRRR